MVDNENCEAINFVKMATNLKTTKEDKAILPIKDFHYEHVQTAIEFYKNELGSIAVQSTNIKVEHKSDKQSIKFFKSWLDKEYISKELYEIFTKTRRDGRLQNLSKEVINISKKYQSKDIIKKLEELQKKYNLFDKKEQEQQTIKTNIDIILSETFV